MALTGAMGLIELTNMLASASTRLTPFVSSKLFDLRASRVRHEVMARVITGKTVVVTGASQVRNQLLYPPGRLLIAALDGHGSLEQGNSVKLRAMSCAAYCKDVRMWCCHQCWCCSSVGMVDTSARTKRRMLHGLRGGISK